MKIPLDTPEYLLSQLCVIIVNEHDFSRSIIIISFIITIFSSCRRAAEGCGCRETCFKCSCLLKKIIVVNLSENTFKNIHKIKY